MTKQYQVFCQYDYKKGGAFIDCAIDSGEQINTLQDVYDVLHDADEPCKISINGVDATQDVLHDYFLKWELEADYEAKAPMCFAMFDKIDEFMALRGEEYNDYQFSVIERQFDYNSSRI